MWTYTTIEQNNVYQAVDILLQMEKGFNFATSESSEKFNNVQNSEYTQSKTSLINLVEKKTGFEQMSLIQHVFDNSGCVYD